MDKLPNNGDAVIATMRPGRYKQGNQASVIIANQEVKGLNTGDTFNINGTDVTVLMVIQLDSQNTELVYQLPSSASDDA